MFYFYVWLITAILLFAYFTYKMGGSVRRNHTSADDTIGMFFVGFFGSLLWPIVLAASICFFPFYLVYKLGVRRADVEIEKKNIWDTLKS